MSKRYSSDGAKGITMNAKTENILTQSIASGEINELIARNARVAYEQGVSRERERIVALLTEVKATWKKPTGYNYPSELERLIDIIETSLPIRTVQKVTLEEAGRG